MPPYKGARPGGGGGGKQKPSPRPPARSGGPYSGASPGGGGGKRAQKYRRSKAHRTAVRSSSFRKQARAVRRNYRERTGHAPAKGVAEAHTRAERANDRVEKLVRKIERARDEIGRGSDIPGLDTQIALPSVVDVPSLYGAAKAVVEGKPAERRDFTTPREQIVNSAQILAGEAAGALAAKGIAKVAPKAAKALRSAPTPSAPKPKPRARATTSPPARPKPASLPKAARERALTAKDAAKMGKRDDGWFTRPGHGTPKSAGKGKGPIKRARASVKANKAAKVAKRAEKRANRPKVIRKAGEATEPIRKHSYAAGTAAVTLGPGAVAAVSHKDPKRLTAPVEGLARAATSDPDKLLGTTARSIPGLVTAPIGLAANVGLTGYRGATTATGLKDYSGKEILEPAKTAGKETLDFGKEMAGDLSSGDPKRIEKALEDKYGLTPFIMAGVPGAKVLGKMGAGRAIGRAARRVPGIKKIPAARDRQVARREVSREIARGQRRAQSEIMGRPKRKKADKEIPGLLTINKALGKVKGRRGTVKRTGEKVTPEHALKTLAEQGIVNERQLDQLIKRHGKRPADVDPRRIVTADVAAYIKDNPHLFTDKNFAKAWDDFGKMQKAGYETSQVAKNMPQAITWDVKLPWDREGYTFLNADSTRTLTKAEKATNKRIEGEFLREMKALRKREGLAEPIWTHDADVMRRAAQEWKPGSVLGYQGRTSYNQAHRTRGVLQQNNRADQSFEALAEGSIVGPRFKRHVNAVTERFVEKNSKVLPVGKGGKNVRVLTEKEAAKAVRMGLIDPEKVALMDGQQFKSAVLDPTIEKTGVEPFLQGVERATQEVYARKAAGDKSAVGRVFVAIEKERVKEFLGQHQRPGGAGQVLAKTQQLSSQALLGYSPSWLAAQPIAEGAQAISAVGVTNFVRGLYEYRKMDKATQAEFDASIGASAGTGAIREAGALLREASPSKGRVGRALQRSKTGRVVHGILYGKYANSIDRRKALAIRRGVAAAKLTKEYDKMRVGLKGLLDEDRALAGKSKQEIFRHYSRNPEARRRLENYVDDVMGNWDALTNRERAMSKVIIFYPFVRMSLQWTMRTYPKRHPVKTSILHFLAQSNADQLEKVYGPGGPSFFAQWASAPLYGGEDGEATGILPMARIAPGSNTFIEALGSEDPSKIRSSTRALNPFIGAAAAAWSGQLPETGRDINFGQEPNDWQRLGLSARTLLGLWAPARLVDTLTGKKYSDKLIARKMSRPRQLFEAINEPKGKRALRSFAVPFLPYEASRQRFMTDVGRLLDLSFNGTTEEKRRADRVLEHLYNKFGIESE